MRLLQRLWMFCRMKIISRAEMTPPRQGLVTLLGMPSSPPAGGGQHHIITWYPKPAPRYSQSFYVSVLALQSNRWRGRERRTSWHFFVELHTASSSPTRSMCCSARASGVASPALMASASGPATLLWLCGRAYDVLTRLLWAASYVSRASAARFSASRAAQRSHIASVSRALSSTGTSIIMVVPG
jgi:hypothetical protein